jgi:hypothetical protein
MKVRRDLPTTAKLRLIRKLAVPDNVSLKVPVRWEQDIGRMLHWFELDWSPVAQCYILALGVAAEEYVRVKVIYGQDLLEPFQYITGLKGLSIVPVAYGRMQGRDGVTQTNLGRSVRLLYHYEAP